MDTARLSFRPGERSQYWMTYTPGAYAVALVETPGFPAVAHPECCSLAVVCAGEYECSESERPGEMLWGWYHLDPETKDDIGDALVAAECEVGRWYYMTIQPIDVSQESRAT